MRKFFVFLGKHEKKMFLNKCVTHAVYIYYCDREKNQKRFVVVRSHRIFTMKKKMWKMKNRMFLWNVIVFEVNKWRKYFPFLCKKNLVNGFKWVTYGALNSFWINFRFYFTSKRLFVHQMHPQKKQNLFYIS